MKESIIKEEILYFLNKEWVFSWDNPSEWFYDSKNRCYKKRNSRYSINWVSDILWMIEWKILCIEVKKPKEYNSTQLSISEIEKRMMKWWSSTFKKYKHILEQKDFIQTIIRWWWVACYPDGRLYRN